MNQSEIKQTVDKLDDETARNMLIDLLYFAVTQGHVHINGDGFPAWSESSEWLKSHDCVGDIGGEK